MGTESLDRLGAAPAPTARPTNYTRYRLLLLGCAFVVILVNPFLNYYLQIDFVQGWYQSLGIGSLWFVSPLEGLESLLVTKSLYLPSLVGMLIPVIVALLLGRVFCSWICPVTLILEGVERVRKLVTGKKRFRDHLVLARRTLWFVLIAELLISMVLGAPLFVFMSPPGLVGREIMMLVFFGTLAIEGVIILLVILMNFTTRRMYCRYFCPLGALLALIGTKRRLRMLASPDACTKCGGCDQVCPMGLSPSTGEGDTAYCWNCGTCSDHCTYDALGFRWVSPSAAVSAPQRTTAPDHAVERSQLQ